MAARVPDDFAPTAAWEPPQVPRRPRRIDWPPAAWGEPVWAVIAPAACGGFLLLTDFTVAGTRITGVDLGTRWDTYTTPLPEEVAVADAGLTRLGLIRTQPWLPGAEPGSLTAWVDRAPRAAGWCARIAARLSRLKPFTQPNPLACPGTSDGTEDRS